MKGTAAFDPAPLAPSDRRSRKIIFHGLADGTVNPVNGERILDEVERSEASLTRSDLDWPIEGGRVSRIVLKEADGAPSPSNGWSKAAPTPGSAATRAAATRKTSASTPRA